MIDAAPEIRYRRGAQLPLVTEQSKRMVLRADARITYEDIGVPAIVDGPVSRAGRSSASAGSSPTAS